MCYTSTLFLKVILAKRRGPVRYFEMMIKKKVGCISVMKLNLTYCCSGMFNDGIHLLVTDPSVSDKHLIS